MPHVRGMQRALVVGAAWCAAILAACSGRSPGELAARDVSTVFFISKSDDHNRVDYGMRLDDHCVPKHDAVFPYWHEFEPVERTHPLGAFEDRAYGVADQHEIARVAGGADYSVTLKRFDRPIEISVRKQANGQCSTVAHTTIDAIDQAEFSDAFAQLGGLFQVDYIELHGRDPKTGAKLSERIQP